MALYSNPGDYLTAGDSVVQLRESEGGLPQAITWIASAAAPHIRHGQQARAEFIAGNGNRHSVHGEVTSVTAEFPPGWLAELLPGAAGSRVSITLDQEPAFSFTDGTRCSIRILLPRQAPVSFLFSGLP